MRLKNIYKQRIEVSKKYYLNDFDDVRYVFENYVLEADNKSKD